jgi:hypothetical protein
MEHMKDSINYWRYEENKFNVLNRALQCDSRAHMCTGQVPGLYLGRVSFILRDNVRGFPQGNSKIVPTLNHD